MKLLSKIVLSLFITCFFNSIGSAETKQGKDIKSEKIVAPKRAPNHLLGVQSPYLQQHIYNSVDWYPWGKEALDKAKAENKPIFLSIGYSTCHWCHVMARESFEDDAIGEFLNKNFIAIKVDRERRPDLDNQFMLVTEAITGTGGWPNSLFLTASAKPFHASTYLPPKEFMHILQQVDKLWRTDTSTLISEGTRISDAISRYMNRTEAARNITPEVIADALETTTKTVDEFHGGFGVAPKFPQESALSFLIDQAERGDGAALKIVMDALDGMLKGGIHDHVGGGFHRYSTDERWLVPHFEKMLYNQAMIGNLLVRAYALSGAERYKHTAVRLFDYVIRDMQDENGGFYSAEDADSVNGAGKKVEGAFYVWSQTDVNEAALSKDGVFHKTFTLTENGNFEGSNILHMEQLPHEIAKSIGMSEKEYYQKLNRELEILRLSRQKKKQPHKDVKILVSWNAVMIEALAHAASIFERPDYYLSAKKASDYIMKNMVSEKGIYRASYNGSIGVYGQLADYAGLGLALLAIEDYAPSGVKVQSNMKTIEKIASDLQHRFGKPWAKEQSALRMTEIADGLGAFPPLDDNPIPSGNALALRLLHSLSQKNGNPDQQQRALLLASALSGHALSNPQMRGVLVNAVNAVNNGSVGNLRTVAKGNVKVGLKLDRSRNQFSLNIHILPGWHINSNAPLEDYFIPTELTVNGTKLSKNQYPQPLEKSLAFNEKKLSLYEGSLKIDGSFGGNQKSSDGEKQTAQKIILYLQACSDKICLQPEKLEFNFWQ